MSAARAFGLDEHDCERGDALRRCPDAGSSGRRGAASLAGSIGALYPGTTIVPASPSSARERLAGLHTIACLPALLANRGARLHLRRHAPRAEVPLREELARLRRGDATQRGLLRGSEVRVRARHVREDHQPIGADLVREERRREILVDHRLHAAQAPAVAHDRHAPSARGDDHHAHRQELPYDVEVQDLLRLRRRDHAPQPAPCGVRAQHEACARDLAGLLRAVEGTHRLRRVRERRIVVVDHHLRDERGDASSHAALGEHIVQGAREHVAELALRLRHAHVEREAVRLAERLLDAHEHVAHLRPVAVPEHELHLRGEEGRKRLERFPREAKLREHGELAFRRRKRVSPRARPRCARWAP
jgi:hypothetical protein